MNNTFQILLNWDKGQTFSERMSAKILALEGFKNIDPQCPAGGPDGAKDIICEDNSGKHYIVGCYFPGGQKLFSDVKKKFISDTIKISQHQVNGFIFITNQKITPEERMELCLLVKDHETIIYHGERICHILDNPKGYGVRLEYLSIELKKEEQLSFLSSHLDLEEHFKEIKNTLDELKRVTSKIAGEIHPRDFQHDTLSALPISGIKFSSRLSIEDLLALQKAVMGDDEYLGFRKVDVWIGKPGESKELADFLPPSATTVINLIYELLKWWRKEYAKIIHASDEEKIFTIAQFHQKFLTIHPFLDGNGRISRVIASLQYKDLLGKEVKFDNVDRKTYYHALQESISGNKKELNNIFLTLI